MRYLGNKTRLAKYISPFLVKNLNGNNYLIDVFAGAFGMISNIDYPKRIAYDKDEFIIALIKAVRDGWTPPEHLYLDSGDGDEETGYKAVREKLDNPEDGFMPAYVGFVGYGCSFGGKWFAGMARGGESGGKTRNHVAESSRNLVKMRPKLQGIKIQTKTYLEASVGEGNVIYCDPPYSTGTKYKTDFDHDIFWDWVRVQSKTNYVYVSEYNAPDDFVSIWEKEHKSGIDSKAIKHKPTVEKLFVLKGSKADG
ncbi:hypothetical protein BH09PAT1_BH09PAT1_8380 [soil metagenome]